MLPRKRLFAVGLVAVVSACEACESFGADTTSAPDASVDAAVIGDGGDGGASAFPAGTVFHDEFEGLTDGTCGWSGSFATGTLTAAGRTGSGCRICFSGSYATLAMYQPFLSAKAYDLQAWIHEDGPSFPTYMHLLIYGGDAGTDVVASGRMDVNVGTGWQRRTASIADVADGSRSIAMRFERDTDAGVDSCIVVDDLVLVRTP